MIIGRRKKLRITLVTTKKSFFRMTIMGNTS